jgi:hypothetical protein
MTELARAWHRYRRQNRFLIAGFLALMVLAVGAFYLVQRTQEASPEDLTNRLLLFVLWESWAAAFAPSSCSPTSA